MSNLLINLYNTTGLNRVVEFVKTMSEGDPEIALDHVLLISRILFAIVMIGFVGYHFDRTKQSVKQSIKSRH